MFSSSVLNRVQPGPAREQFERLRSQRSTLERLYQAAENLEQMSSGLQAAVLLGNDQQSLNASALRFFEGLSAKTREQPSERLRGALSNLEVKIRDNIERVMAIAEQDVLDTDAPVGDEAEQLVKEFRRLAQTAVGLRILLKERGESVECCTFPVNPDSLRQRIDTLSEKEQECREVVEKEIVSSLENVKAVLDAGVGPAVMKVALKASIAQLERELHQVRSGGSMAALARMSAEAPPVDAARSEPERPTAPAKQARAPKEPPKGFLGKLKHWLDTPWSVKWKDID